MHKIILISYLLFAILMLEGCTGTLDGAGQDIERAGQKIQKTF